MAGVNVPLIPFAHEYLITRPSGLPLDMPTMRDPSLLVYYRPESGGLIMGGYEREPAPWGLDKVIARRATQELRKDEIVNLGFGISALVPRLLPAVASPSPGPGRA